MTQAPTQPAEGRSALGKLYDITDLLFWLAVVNLCLIVFTLAGGIILGFAPALVAAVSLSRSRLRGDSLPIFKTFAATWSREFVPANLVVGPLGLAILLFALNLLYFAPRDHALVGPLWAGLAITVVLTAFTTSMYAHYDLPISRYLMTSGRFMIRHLPGALLIAAVTGLVIVAVRFLPGLLPVIAPSTWVYVATALCLSFYAHNDRSVDDPPKPPASVQTSADAASSMTQSN